jgi:hypothetical protein
METVKVATPGDSAAQHVFRWIAFLPGALIAAFLAGAGFRIVSWVGNFLSGMSNEGFLNRLWVEVIANVVTGGVLVYIGARIAPSNRRNVAYLLTVLVILLAGFAAFPAIARHRWWDLVGCIATAVGASGVAYSVSEGEVDLEKKL